MFIILIIFGLITFQNNLTYARYAQFFPTSVIISSRSKKVSESNEQIIPTLDIYEKFNNLENNFVNIEMSNQFKVILESNQLIADPTDKQTVLNMAMISSNAYWAVNETSDWYLVEGYDVIMDHGWDSDGLRGHIYISFDEPIVIISFKGTSLNDETSETDKYVDNLMFSCCCAMVTSRWDGICDCHNLKEMTCDNMCVTDHTNQSDISYFDDAVEIYQYVLKSYPNHTIWTTGHSLGGAVASLVAVEHNSFAMVYGTPGDVLYGTRLGMNLTNDNMVYHYASSADPIFNGNCNGVRSGCNLIGYAMETKCHTGNVCVYPSDSFETINEHRIEILINNYILVEPVPICTFQSNCNDCDKWTFV
jgi:lipase ATG15